MMAQYLKLRNGEVIPPPADQAEVIELCAAGALWVDVEIPVVEQILSEPESGTPQSESSLEEADNEDSDSAEGEAQGETSAAAVEETNNTTAKRGKKGGKS